MSSEGNGFSTSQSRMAKSAIGEAVQSGLLCDDCGFHCEQTCAFMPAGEQPYFQAYRLAHRERGRVAGFEFIIWIGNQWGRWRALRGLGPHAGISEAQRADFELWLARTVDHPTLGKPS